jgi:hypothetical protein
MTNDSTSAQREALLPCPFCGEEACKKDRREYDDSRLHGVRRVKMVEVFCMNAACGASLKGSKLSEQTIVKAWNTRHPTQPPADEVVERVRLAIKEARVIASGHCLDRGDFYQHDKMMAEAALSAAGVVKRGLE